MPLMPVMILPMLLLWALAITFLGGGGYLFWQWYTGAVVGASYLILSLASLVLALAGRPIMLLIFGRNGADTPHSMRTGEIRRVQRPDGTTLQVELYGPPDAQPLVMTHGWGTDSTEWYYAKLALAERFRVIVWDLPGLGKSDQRRNKNYRLEQLADDLHAVVEQAGDKPVILVGHSIGGMITQTYCRLFAHELHTKVRGLVLVHTTYINPVNTTTLSGLMRVLQKPVFTPLLYLMIWLSPLVWLMNWLSYYNGSMHVSTALSGFVSPTRRQLEFATLFSARAWPAVVARGMLGMFQFDERATLPTITVPTLVIPASRDPMLLPEASHYIHQAIPSSDFVPLAPAKHMGLMERHAEFDSLVSSFVSALPTIRGTELEERAV